MTSPSGRHAVALTPVVLAWLASELLLRAGDVSFDDVLNLIGLVANCGVAGMVPMVLLLAARRRGELVPGRVLGWLGRTWVVVAISAFFMAILAAFGIVVWTAPIERALALIALVALAVFAVAIVRGGVFVPRAVVELFEDLEHGTAAVYRVVAGGRPARAHARISTSAGDRDEEGAGGELAPLDHLRRLEIERPGGEERELELLSHRRTATGDDETFPVRATVREGERETTVEVGPAAGAARVALDGNDWQVVVEPADDTGTRGRPLPFE